ncbi:hypothetical protein QJS10_CPB12g01213 [Acorus calamus]|uniref:Transducin/WD40 repeat-like superfamily protein n=1 Tax=Acorus calamus TaxID=4465 RepID=A0AAV9DNI1_ACOCL|nr:hypothetical protein QJS10_CPB12g01213 [Acorus calamus]
MAEYLNEELQYVDDYFNIVDFDEEFGEVRSGGSDAEDDVDSNKQKMDTSAGEARSGKDVQGIPWERLNFTRDKYREMRLRQYKNYENVPSSRHELEKECMKTEKGSSLYGFQFNTRLVKPTIVHFQLRNLLWATSKHDVYLMQNYSVMHWSSLLRRGKEVLNVAGQIIPSVRSRDSIAQALSRVQISTMSVRDGLLVAGGFQGELLCKYLNRPGVAFCTKLASDENAITNAVDSYRTPNGSIRLIAANNDCKVRVLDADSFTLLGHHSFPWSVNNTSVSPDGKLLAILGDSPNCLIADPQSGKVIGNLKGHLDYSFASAWHPDGHVLATGNQDTTCRLWDVRKLSESFAVLRGRMGAIRAINFSSDGRFMAMAEPADFVHIYDTQSGYSKAQEIDLFGEIAGISFSPDTEALFVGVADRTYGGLLEYNRTRHNHYLDCML